MLPESEEILPAEEPRLDRNLKCELKTANPSQGQKNRGRAATPVVIGITSLITINYLILQWLWIYKAHNGQCK